MRLFDWWVAFTLRVRVILAKTWRRFLWRTTFIAITGSCGKTTAKEVLVAILSERESVVCTDGTKNSIRAITSVVLRCRPWHRFVVAETGTVGPGDLAAMASILRPDIAVALSVLLEHYSAFRTLENVAAEKARLVESVRAGGLVFLNADDEFVARMEASGGGRVVTFGRAYNADVRARDVVSDWPHRLQFLVEFGDDALEVATRLVGEHQVSPVLAAVAVALNLGCGRNDISTAVQRFQPVVARMQPVGLPSGATLIRDELKCSPAVIEAAFEEMRRASAARKILVFGDVSDTSKSPRERQKKIGRLAAGIFNVLVFIGAHADVAVRSALRNGVAPGQARAFTTVEAAAEFLRTELRAGDLVLLKGKRKEHLTRIIFRLAGTIQCDKPSCEKVILCDACAELGADEAGQALATRYPTTGIRPKR